MTRLPLRLAATTAATWAVVAGPALAQKLGGGGGADVPVWRVLGALLLCLLLAVGAAVALKTRLRGATPIFGDARRRLNLVETVRLSHQIDVCLLTCDGREIIVAAGPHGATFLPEMPPRPEPAASDAEPATPPTDT